MALFIIIFKNFTESKIRDLLSQIIDERLSKWYQDCRQFLTLCVFYLKNKYNFLNEYIVDWIHVEIRKDDGFIK